MAGGPSQLETFDPHPTSAIAQGSRAIATAVRGVRVGEGLPRLAEVMSDVTLVRSVVSQEADHERAVYNMKTGYRPSSTVVQPSIGAIVCHELEDVGMDLPRHISILPDSPGAASVPAMCTAAPTPPGRSVSPEMRSRSKTSTPRSSMAWESARGRN